MAKTKTSWGFDVGDLSTTTRPQDDFFHYVHERWFGKNPIPEHESRWGHFMKLRFETDKKIHALFTELESTKNLTSGSPEQLLRDFYRSGMDIKTRNAHGMRPLDPLRTLITNMREVSDLTPTLAKLHLHGASGIFSSGIGQDSKHTEKYAYHFVQDGLGMPERDYYLKDEPENMRVRTAYRTYAEKLYRVMGASAKEAARRRDILLKIETALAEISMQKEDFRDPEKTYNKFTLSQLQKSSLQIDWSLYLRLTGVRDLSYVIVMQPGFFTGLSEVLLRFPLEEWKIYLEWHLVNSFAPALSARLERLSFSFYGEVLTGTKKMQPLWRRVLNVVDGSMGELTGRMYVKKYFPPSHKKKMDTIVNDLFTVFEKRIHAVGWMTPATKKKALQKLHALTRKIGYPKKWKSYTGLTLSPKNYAENLMRVSEFEHRREMKKLKKPIDRAEWEMYAHEVNAYFAPTMNDIVFPAGILQKPFFDPDADDALNYGATGMVIGHEMTHGFDDEGSKYDAKGNIKEWWTAADRTHFDAKAKRIEKQFDAYTVADGVRVNGKLTCGENIADLGGLSIAYDAYQLQLARTGRKDIDGLSPEERFFISFALFEGERMRPEQEKMTVLTNPHSPAIFRINGPLSNFEPFYKTYNVQKGDKLYRAPEDREMVW